MNRKPLTRKESDMAKTNSKRDGANTKTNTPRKSAGGKTNVREETPLAGMTLYDVAGPRCLDCIFLACVNSGAHAGDCECHYYPPGDHGWPRLCRWDIDKTFCSRFTTNEARQPLRGAGDVPRFHSLGQLFAGR